MTTYYLQPVQLRISYNQLYLLLELFAVSCLWRFAHRATWMVLLQYPPCLRKPFIGNHLLLKQSCTHTHTDILISIYVYIFTPWWLRARNVSAVAFLNSSIPAAPALGDIFVFVFFMASAVTSHSLRICYACGTIIFLLMTSCISTSLVAEGPSPRAAKAHFGTWYLFILLTVIIVIGSFSFARVPDMYQITQTLRNSASARHLHIHIYM